jgi:hypothetical protein
MPGRSIAWHASGATGFIISIKFARFNEIFPGAAKSDRIDARKGLELFQLSDHLPLAKEVLQEVRGTPTETPDGPGEY